MGFAPIQPTQEDRKARDKLLDVLKIDNATIKRITAYSWEITVDLGQGRSLGISLGSNKELANGNKAFGILQEVVKNLGNYEDARISEIWLSGKVHVQLLGDAKPLASKIQNIAQNLEPQEEKVAKNPFGKRTATAENK